MLLTMNKITEEVGKYYDIPSRTLTNYGRTKGVAEARKLAYYLCKRYSRNSLTEIGDFFGRHHTTIVKVLRNTRDIEHGIEYFKKEFNNRLING